VPALNALAAKAFDETTTFADRVHFVHVYVMEAHPMTPDPTPYYGAVAENVFSIVGQPRNLDGRRSNAALMVPKLDATQLLLIDDLSKQVNPVWCTYGPAPNSAFLIGSDGVIVVAQLWADVGRMEGAIRRLFREEP
jgi:hypothetical protein